MGKEIERKFLVKHDLWQKAKKGTPIYIAQNYIFNEKTKTLRVRIKDEQGFITIKKGRGLVRDEYEYEIPLKDAQDLLRAETEFAAIEKQRYLIDFKGKTWEIDQFMGLNQGLIIAEIELEDEHEHFELPDFIDKEVSGYSKYLNSALVQHPFTKWK